MIEEEHKKVRKRIETELRNIRDYEGEIHSDFVVDEDVTDSGISKVGSGLPSYRLDHRFVSTYTGERGRDIHVPGIIVDVNSTVLRTNDVFVDSLLGQESALSDVSEQADAARLWQMRYGKTEN